MLQRCPAAVVVVVVVVAIVGVVVSVVVAVAVAVAVAVSVGCFKVAPVRAACGHFQCTTSGESTA